MKYTLFARLYQEVADYDSLEIYIAERGWQDWMSDFVAEDDITTTVISDMLTSIYTLAKTTLKVTRESRDLSRVQFCRDYAIPLRTVEDWEAGKSKLADYQKMLIDYTFFVGDFEK